MFSGIGCFEIALEKKNHQIVGACESDEYARQVYSEHFPNVNIWPDATKLNPEELPDFDLLVAGFPCQAFSNAGKRLGFEESRGTLFYEVARIAREKRPKLLLLENVTGLLSHDRGRTFAEILYALDEVGYDAEWQVLNTKHFIPQNRERVFIIGHLRGQSRRKIFPIGEIYQRYTSEEKEQDEDAMTIMLAHNTQNGRSINYGYSFALTTRREQAVYYKKQARYFTPLECERLQGIPDNWTRNIKEGERIKCIGNAVSVPVIEYILDYIGEERVT